MVKDSVKTGDKFQGINWQICNNISNRHGIQLQPSALVTVTGSGGKVQIEMGKKDVKKMLKVLGSA